MISAGANERPFSKPLARTLGTRNGVGDLGVRLHRCKQYSYKGLFETVRSVTFRTLNVY